MTSGESVLQNCFIILTVMFGIVRVCIWGLLEISVAFPSLYGAWIILLGVLGPRLLGYLKKLTHEDFGEDKNAWVRWWNSQHSGLSFDFETRKP